METQNEFVSHILELLKPLGPVSSKAMFGGVGFYMNDLMFGLVIEDTFYLKADEMNRPDFESRGLKPYSSYRQGSVFSLPYYQVPLAATDNSETLCRWAEKAYNASVRSAQTKDKKKRDRRASERQ